MKKTVIYTEAAYLIGLVLIAIGVVFSEKADFGMSMIVAPAFILHKWLSQYFSFFTFGMAEYCLQAVLLIITAIAVRRFKISYFFSFVTAVIYGFILDGLLAVFSFLPTAYIYQRIIYYIIGVVVCSAGVAMIFHTYISPEVYELFVKEFSERYGFSISKVKTCYDACSCIIGLIMSFAIFGMWHFVGVSWGTVICTVVNGFAIGRFTALYSKLFEFKDGLPLKKYFDK